MTTYKRFLSVSVLIAAMITASCSRSIPGAAVLPTYDGPEVVVNSADTAILSPGAPITIGNGALSASCTAGWVVRATESGEYGMLTAGHCLRALEGSRVYLNYRSDRLSRKGTTQQMNVGKTLTGTYSAGGTDVGVFLFDYSEDNQNVPIAPIPAGGILVPSDSSGRAARDDVDALQGDRVCWYTGVTRVKRGYLTEACGTVDSGGALLTVTPDSDVEVRPQDAGAPAVLATHSPLYVPLGVVSYVKDGKVMISVVGTAVAGTGVEIMTGFPR